MSMMRRGLFVLSVWLALAIWPQGVHAVDPGSCLLQTGYDVADPSFRPVHLDPTQSFTVQRSFRLQTLELLLEHTSSSIGSIVTTVSLKDGLGPGANVLRSTTFMRVLGPHWFSLDFADIDLVAGETYYIQTHIETGWWLAHGPDGYPDGTAHNTNVATDLDYIFRLCGQRLDSLCAREEGAYTEWSGATNNIAQLAQSFSVVEPTRMSNIAVQVETDLGLPCTFTLHLQDGPTASANVYRELTTVAIPGERWYTFDLEDMDLEVGQPYFIRLSGCAERNLLWQHTSNPYPRGVAYMQGEANVQDDFAFRMCALLALLPVGVEPPTLTAGTLSIRVAPNPALRSTMFEVQLPQATSSLQLNVHDASGRLVRRLAGGSYPAGRFQMPWDLRNSDGSLLPGGVYFVRLRTTTQLTSAPLVIVR